MTNSKMIAVALVAIVVVAGAGALVLTMDGKGGDDRIELPEGTNLNIFGNSNGDSRVDSDDIGIIEDCISGKTSVDDLVKVTDKSGRSHILADANDDGVVDGKDKEIVDSIIAGKAKELIVLDGHLNYVKVPVNPKKVVAEYFSNCEILQLVGAQKSIVAVDRACMTLGDYYLQGVPDRGKVLDMGAHRSPDYEKVAELNPDIWLTYGDSVEAKQEHSNAKVLGLNLTDVDLEDVRKSGVVTGTLLAGYIFNNVDAAEKYVKWVIGIWNQLNDVSSKMEDSDRPVVFYTGYGQYITNPDTQTLRCFLDPSVLYQAVKLAGGSNLIDKANLDIESTASNKIDNEFIVDSRFDYLFVHAIKYTGGGTTDPKVPNHGYTTDDASEWNAARENVAKMPLFKDKLSSDRVVLSPGDFMNNASGGLLNAVLLATTINADLFPGLDMTEVHQQYIDIMGFDFDLSEHGVFYAS